MTKNYRSVYEVADEWEKCQRNMGNKSGIITLDFSRTKVALVEKIGEMC